MNGREDLAVKIQANSVTEWVILVNIRFRRQDIIKSHLSFGTVIS